MLTSRDRLNLYHQVRGLTARMDGYLTMGPAICLAGIQYISQRQRFV